MKVTAFPAKIKKLIVYLKKKNTHDPGELARFVGNLKISPVDLQAWEHFSHKKKDSYGRILVYGEEYFEIMVMSWAPEDYSAVHDHGQTKWGIVQTFGASEHSVYQLIENRLELIGRVKQRPQDIICVDHELIHQMGNPSAKESFLSLHIYGGSRSQDSITREAKVFDLWGGTTSRVNGGVFYGLSLSEVVDRQDGLESNALARYLDGVELFLRLSKVGKETDSESEMMLEELINLEVQLKGQTPKHLKQHLHYSKEKLHKKRS
jgi:predicted metal-dependent enzyme (double-stranded beta helix superfamily)